MANHRSAEGHVEIGANVVAEITGMTLNQSCSVIDDTEIGDTWKTKQAGMKEWKGGLDCRWDETDTSGQGALTVGAEVTFNVYFEGNTSGDTKFSGSAIVTSIDHSAASDGMVEVSFSFEGNGALTESTVV